jgi:hypothetical protein
MSILSKISVENIELLLRSDREGMQGPVLNDMNGMRNFTNMRELNYYASIGPDAFIELIKFYGSEAQKMYGVRPPKLAKALNIFAKVLGYPHWEMLRDHYSKDFVGNMMFTDYMELLMDTYDERESNAAHPFTYLKGCGWKQNKFSLMCFEKTFSAEGEDDYPVKISFHDSVDVQYMVDGQWSDTHGSSLNKTVKGVKSSLLSLALLSTEPGATRISSKIFSDVINDVVRVFDVKYLHVLKAYRDLRKYSDGRDLNELLGNDLGSLHQPAVLCNVMNTYHAQLKKELSIKGLSKTKVANVLMGITCMFSGDLLSRNAAISDRIYVKIGNGYDLVMSVSAEGVLYRKVSVGVYTDTGTRREKCIDSCSEVTPFNGPLISYHDINCLVDRALQCIYPSRYVGENPERDTIAFRCQSWFVYISDSLKGVDINSHFYKGVVAVPGEPMDIYAMVKEHNADMAAINEVVVESSPLDKQQALKSAIEEYKKPLPENVVDFPSKD